jgi:hypothetical protein
MGDSGGAIMTEAEQCLWKELIAIVAEIDRLLGTVARDATWKEKHGNDYSRTLFFSPRSLQA